MSYPVIAQKRNTSRKQGITMLLVIVVLTALLSISISIFNVMYSQMIISAEMGYSFVALYAADQGTEKLIRMDRDGTPLCTPATCPPASPLTCVSPAAGCPVLTSGACYDYSVSKDASYTVIEVFGKYPCFANPRRIDKRGLRVTYPNPI